VSATKERERERERERGILAINISDSSTRERGPSVHRAKRERVFSTVRVIRSHPSAAVINDHENGRKNGAPIVRSDKAKRDTRKTSIYK